MFDLAESDAVFRSKGEEAYRRFQEQHLDQPFERGVSFSFIKRLLSLNDLSTPGDPLVEVILLSRNDPDTGLRVMKSIEHYGLGMTRAIFMQGKSPYAFIPALNISLFLSGNAKDVSEALALGLPAGLVLPSAIVDDDEDQDLRIAFDFDGVLVDDASERIGQAGTLADFHEHESKNVMTTHNPGPLKRFLAEVKRLQELEEAKKLSEPGYRNRIHVSVVTARNAPSHERAITTLKNWGLMVNDAFFLGGIEKAKVLAVLRPHIFFDDQPVHLRPAAAVVPSVHVPFGVANESDSEAED
jgi:5'-nucleotidase